MRHEDFDASIFTLKNVLDINKSHLTEKKAVKTINDIHLGKLSIPF